MNSNINSSGLYDVNSYNLIATNATILSTLNVSGTTTFSNNVGIGINNTTNMLKIYNPLYTTPLLVLDAGIQNLPRNQNPRAIGKPLLGLGNKAWTDIGDYYGIGFGWHAGGVNDCYCGEIGLIITNTSNGEYGDLVFSTRSTNNWYTPATERMRITSAGNVTINNSLNVSGITTLSNNTNIIGTLNISGNTLLNNFITINSPLYINTNQSTTISALSVNSTSASVLVNIVQNLVWNDGVNYALNVTGYSMFGGVQINGQDSNNIYKRVGDLTIASPSLNSIILKSNYGNWEAMRLNSAGISMNTSLYVSGLTILNNATTHTSSLYVSGTTILNNTTTCTSSLNVVGLSLLNRIATYNNTLPDFTAVNNATSHSMINVFPGINGQQGELTADTYNINLSSFAYGTYMSGPQPYLTVNCTMLYNGSNTKLTLQAYGGATGVGYNSKIILNGGNNSAGNISFINDNTTTCIMNSSGCNLYGNTACSGNLSVPNITLGSAGKINSYDDNHYIQIDQPNNTLTLQEYGTISLNIGPSKTQRAIISSIGMRINGSLGIATSPSYPLQVNGGTSRGYTNVYVRTGYYGGSDFNTGSYTSYVTAAFDNSLFVGGNIINASDIRIKQNINDIDDDGALQQILKIQPKTYKYIDVLTRGDSVVYGFIAQQIKEVIPEAVSIIPEIIPNIYKQGTYNNKIITLDIDVSNELSVNDKIKVIDDKDNPKMVNVININSNKIEIDEMINSSDVFVFGKEINDFHSLKKEYIFTLNVCATQELYKLIQQQNIIIEDLKNRIAILENKLV